MCDTGIPDSSVRSARGSGTTVHLAWSRRRAVGVVPRTCDLGQRVGTTYATPRATRRSSGSRRR